MRNRRADPLRGRAPQLSPETLGVHDEGSRRLKPGDWPDWWDWELEISPHVVKRMEDRRFSEIQLRGMIEKATAIRPDSTPDRWLVETKLSRKKWLVVVEPDPEFSIIVVVTAYPDNS